MDLLEGIASRRSIRAFKPDPVEEGKLERILEAGAAAPTACNLQPFRVVVIDPRGREEELRKIYDKAWFVAAPVILLLCSVPGEAWSRRDGRNYAEVDAAIAMDHMILAATALGLGSCWVAAFDPAAARSILALETGWEPIAFTPVGYAAETPKPRPRKPAGQLAVRR